MDPTNPNAVVPDPSYLKPQDTPQSVIDNAKANPATTSPTGKDVFGNPVVTTQENPNRAFNENVTTPTTPTTGGPDTGKSSSFEEVMSYIKGLTGDTKSVTDVTPEQRAEMTAASESKAAADKAAIDVQAQQENDKIESDFTQTTGMAKNQLAKLGILGNSTASVQYMTDLDTQKAKLQSLTRQKYEVQKLDIDAAAKTALTDKITEQIKATNDEIQKGFDRLKDATTLGVSLFKELNTEDQNKIQNDLEQQKINLDEKYKAGQITIDEYNAETQRIGSQIDQYNAESGRMNADTNRMKENRLSAGEGTRPSYAEFLGALGQNRGMPAVDPSDPKNIEMYFSAYPVNYNDARKNMTDAQKLRVNSTQEMIDKGSMTYTEAVSLPSTVDIAPFLSPPGLTSMQRLFFDLQGLGADTSQE